MQQKVLENALSAIIESVDLEDAKKWNATEMS